MSDPLPGRSSAKTGIGFSLYLITDSHQTNGRPLVDVVRAALDGGARAVQLREKGLSGRELYLMAVKLRLLTSEYGAKLFINDRIDIAMAVAADGVHLGVGSLPVAEARHLAGSDLLIGYSSHSITDADSAEAGGADFVTFGPVFHTPSKMMYGEPLGLSNLVLVCKKIKIPVFALGGVKLDNVPEVLNAGAAGVSMISAIIAATDPKKETASLLKTIEEHVINS